jgi:hypothetical protein
MVESKRGMEELRGMMEAEMGPKVPTRGNSEEAMAPEVRVMPMEQWTMPDMSVKPVAAAEGEKELHACHGRRGGRPHGQEYKRQQPAMCRHVPLLR